MDCANRPDTETNEPTGLPEPSSTELSGAEPSSTDLCAALRTLRESVADARFPLDHGDAVTAREAARALRTQLDGYLLPRTERLDAPLLAVVGGSTGAGKSTLVNSLVRAPVSRAGVLRPTTVGPVLVCHPTDGAWFGGRRLLPGLERAGEPGEGVLHVVNSPKLRPGLALLDAPDIDSVVAANRELAHDLLSAADLWLFVTTAARYADEVPWRVLHRARDRGTVVAVVLDRVPPPAREDVMADLNRLLSEQGLPAAPLFTVAESTLDSQGLLATSEVEEIEAFLTDVATSDLRRRTVTRRSLRGAIVAAAATADDLAFAAVQQCAAADALAATVRRAYDCAAATVAARLADPGLLHGGVYARWRDAVSSGELQRALRAVRDPARARPAPAPPGRAVIASISTALAALLVEAETLAEEEIADRWRVDPAAHALLAQGPVDTTHCAVAAGDLVRDWQAWLSDCARDEGPPRSRATTTASLVLLATVAAVAPSTVDESAVGAPVEALRRVVGEPAVAGLAGRARDELRTRVGEHFTHRSRRWLHRIAALGVDRELPPRLRQAAADVSVTRRLVLDHERAA